MFSCLKLWLLWVGLHSHSASAAWNLSPWSVAPVSSVCFCIACKGEEGLKSPVSLTGGEGTLSVETDSHQYWFKVSLLKHFCNCNAMICTAIFVRIFRNSLGVSDILTAEELPPGLRLRVSFSAQLLLQLNVQVFGIKDCCAVTALTC